MVNQTIYPFGTDGQLPSSIGVINDLITGGADKALSAEMGKELYSKHQQKEIITLMSVASWIGTDNNWGTLSGAYTGAFVAVQRGELINIKANDNNGTYYAILTSNTIEPGSSPSYATGQTGRIELEAGAEITIQVPAGASYIWINTKRYNNIDTKPASVSRLTEISFEELKFYKSRFDEERLVKAYITGANKWLVGADNYQCKFLPMERGKLYRLVANENYGCSYAVVTTDSVVDGETPDYDTGWTKYRTLSTGEVTDVSTANEGCYLYITCINSLGNTTPSDVLISIDGEVLTHMEKFVTDYAKKKSVMPEWLELGEPTDIIYSIDDFLLAHEYDEGNSIDNLKFSNDLGKTWTTTQNIWGILINVFMFADGTLFFAAKNNGLCKCYWTKDFDTFSEATVLDQADAQGNRSTFTALSGETRWGVIAGSSKHTYIDGVEHYLFGDYVISTQNPRLWYATCDENGVTVRCAFRFGTDMIDGVVIPARHYHGFIYNQYNGYCYALTGDEYDEDCNVMRGKHDENHVWTWERLAYGIEYKIGDIVFDEGSMYFTTDYTDSSLADKKGLISCPTNDINANRFRYWFHPSAAFMLEGSHNTSNPAAISSFINDTHGWKILGTDYAGNSKVLMAKGGHNFVWVDNTANKKLKFFIGPNNNGDVYVWWYNPGYSVVGEGWIKFSHRTTYNFTQAMRNSGATDFFEGWVGTPR